MQLKLQRSQRAGGIVGNKVIFCVDARAEYSPAETSNISKYRLGGQVIYNSQAARRHLDHAGAHLDRVDSDRMSDKAIGLVRGAASLAIAKMHLNISIASLGRGHHIECQDLPELLNAENALMEACRNLKQYLTAAATFNGSIILVDFDDGEKVHTSQGTLEIAALPPPRPPSGARDQTIPGAGMRAVPQDIFTDVWNGLRTMYRLNPKTSQIGGAVLASVFLLALFGAGVGTLLCAALLIGGTVVYSRRY